MIIELDTKFKNSNINSAEKAYMILIAVFNTLDAIDKDKEHFFVLGLKRNKILKYLDLVSVGTLSGTVVHAREVFRRAIANASDSIIIAHNHPSGNILTSNADDTITKSLKEAGKIIGIQVVDHIVFCQDEFYSYAENGKI
jgi:DNA repair protein RadC